MNCSLDGVDLVSWCSGYASADITKLDLLEILFVDMVVIVCNIHFLHPQKIFESYIVCNTSPCS